jgi:hypothetical protein
MCKLHPRDRAEFLKKQRKILEKSMLKARIKLDKGIMVDPYRVSRVINSFNGNKNKKCYSLMDSNSPFLGTEFYLTTPNVTSRLGLPYIDEAHGNANCDVPVNNYSPESSKSNDLLSNKHPVQPIVGDLRPGVSKPNIFYKFISNIVYGVNNNYVPYIEIRKERNYKILTRRLQDKYNLGTIYVFETKERYSLLSLKCCDKRRIEKILKFAKSENQGQFEKYGHVWIKTSDLIKDGKKEENKLIQIIPGEIKGNISRPHQNFIKHLLSQDACDREVMGREPRCPVSSSCDTFIANQRRGMSFTMHNLLVKQIKEGRKVYVLNDLIGDEKNDIFVMKMKEAHS